MITYNEIYEASRKERYSDALQELPQDFILEVKTYLNEKKQVALKEDESFSEIIAKTKKQIENAYTLFKEIMLRRRKKILNLVLIAAETGISKQDFENMLSVEKDLFEQIMKSVEKADAKVSEILNSKMEESNEKPVLFKEDVKEFMGLDGNKIGPFKKDDRVRLASEIVAILEEDNKVEILEF